MKSFLPWLLVVALIAGVYFLYAQVKDRDAQVAKLSQDNLEVAQLRAENEELKKIPLQTQELDRLRKEHDELLRLRNETQRTKEQVKQLTAQLAAAQAQTAAVQAQNEKAQQIEQQATQLANENQDLRKQADRATSEEKVAQQQIATCANNLRIIDAAKQQWALENKKTATDIPTPEDIAPYLPNPAQIVCPAGGVYSINAINTAPTCSVPSHNLPK
ncbi:MAG TPA: hypothetical protein VG754_04240 [Verrucomicrobiae bacterium]|jgi:uncharacterized protein (DUF3084 family)|nr:hypothetical protein [Verrucomicrobiae bacterium]